MTLHSLESDSDMQWDEDVVSSESDVSDEEQEGINQSPEQWLGRKHKKIHWLHKLHAFDEDTMVRLMGRDLTQYLKFLKYQAVMFFVIFLLSFGLMIPLYWSGSDA